MRVTPINMAEAIIEPFWDPAFGALAQWTVQPGEPHGLEVEQFWCYVAVRWARRPERGPALSMSRECAVDVTGYDDLLVSLVAPEGSILGVRVLTDKGELAYSAPPATALKKEHAFDLQGAGRLRRLVLELATDKDGIAIGWLNWIGLRNRAFLERYERQWKRFDPRWEAYLKPESYEPTFKPVYGFLVNEEDLAGLRRRHEALFPGREDSPIFNMAAQSERQVPEDFIGEFVKCRLTSIFNRDRDGEERVTALGSNAALAGVLGRDKRLQRLAARYGMALAMCGHWDESFISHFPGGTFDERAFPQAVCAAEAVLILDLAGEWFTELGRDLILRRLALDALGFINFTTWKYDYIHHCNQLAWFTPARLLACLLLERHWPRLKPYTEIARAELLASLETTILPDGGYPEGPTYFRCVGHDGGLSLFYYARARGLDFPSAIPDALKRCSDLGEALISTDETQDCIPCCDAKAMHDIASLTTMSVALPGSAWTRMLDKARAAQNGLLFPRPSTAFADLAAVFYAWSLAEKSASKCGPPKSFVVLPDMGIMASTRRMGGETVKWFLMGNKAGAGHAHEDKGHFVLEFAGETFAMDPGSCPYGSPFAALAKHCERHNMLVPVGVPERPHPPLVIPRDVKPRGHGDGAHFHAELEATPGWEPYYALWRRAWDSPSPDVMTITDDYRLVKGDGVEFYWLTRKTPVIEGRILRLTGARGEVTIEAPSDCSLRVDALPFHGGQIHQRIAIRKNVREGRLSVQVRLRLP